MNKCELVGRLTKDPEIKATSSDKKYCNFTIAVDRPFKDSNGQRQADFVNCVAWNQTAVFVQKYFKKGSRIGVVGSIQTRTFEDNEGTKHFVTEVLVSEAEFVESGNGKKDETPSAPEEPVEEPAPNTKPEDLPFEI